MVGNFIFENPTKIIFGEGSLNALSEELKKYPRRILFVYIVYNIIFIFNGCYTAQKLFFYVCTDFKFS